MVSTGINTDQPEPLGQETDPILIEPSPCSSPLGGVEEEELLNQAIGTEIRQ